MGILARFGSIMSANINALLDKCEDPEKMIDQYLREAVSDLAEVKKETAGVMAVEAKAKRAYEEHMAEVNKYNDLAKRALQAGNEGDARTFLAKKQSLDAQTAGLLNTYQVAQGNSQKLRDMYTKLAGDVESLKARRNNVKATMAVAKTQETVNRMGEASDKIGGSLGAFARMEEKANNMLDTANAMATLNEEPADPAADLEAKYGAGSSTSVDDELAALKAEMGIV